VYECTDFFFCCKFTLVKLQEKPKNSDMPDLNHVNCRAARKYKFDSMPMKNHDILNTVQGITSQTFRYAILNFEVLLENCYR